MRGSFDTFTATTCVLTIPVPPVPWHVPTLQVTLDDIKVAASDLSSNLHFRRISMATTFERLLLIAFADISKRKGTDAVALHDIFLRIKAILRTVAGVSAGTGGNARTAAGAEAIDGFDDGHDGENDTDASDTDDDDRDGDADEGDAAGDADGGGAGAGAGSKRKRRPNSNNDKRTKSGKIGSGSAGAAQNSGNNSGAGNKSRFKLDTWAKVAAVYGVPDGVSAETLARLAANNESSAPSDGNGSSSGSSSKTAATGAGAGSTKTGKSAGAGVAVSSPLPQPSGKTAASKLVSCGAPNGGNIALGAYDAAPSSHDLLHAALVLHQMALINIDWPRPDSSDGQWSRPRSGCGPLAGGVMSLASVQLHEIGEALADDPIVKAMGGL